MPKVTNSNVYGARWAIEHDADERENLGWKPEMIGEGKLVH